MAGTTDFLIVLILSGLAILAITVLPVLLIEWSFGKIGMWMDKRTARKQQAQPPRPCNCQVCREQPWDKEQPDEKQGA